MADVKPSSKMGIAAHVGESDVLTEIHIRWLHPESRSTQ